jgi:hypothetical protein
MTKTTERTTINSTGPSQNQISDVLISFLVLVSVDLLNGSKEIEFEELLKLSQRTA